MGKFYNLYDVNHRNSIIVYLPLLKHDINLQKLYRDITANVLYVSSVPYSHILLSKQYDILIILSDNRYITYTYDIFPVKQINTYIHLTRQDKINNLLK